MNAVIDHIADAPVGGRPINISASSQGGFIQGGRSEHITAAQLNEIAARARSLGLGLSIVPVIEKVLERELPDLPADRREASRALLEHLKGLSFEGATKVIMAINRDGPPHPLVRSAQSSRRGEARR